MKTESAIAKPVAPVQKKPSMSQIEMESLYDAMIKSNDDLATYEAAQQPAVVAPKTQDINFVQKESESESSKDVEAVSNKKTKKHHKKNKSKKVLKKPESESSSQKSESEKLPQK